VRRREFRSVDGAQLAAKKRLPKSVYEYVEGGTEGRLTVAANRNSFNEIEFLPRAGIVSDKVDLRTTILGCDLSMPVIVAPAGFIRLAHRDGELGAARAAGTVGTAIGISTLSSYPIEEIRSATSGPVFYQLYFAGGRQGAEIAIERAKDAGCEALIVTVDLAASAGRERSFKGGGIPTKIDLKNALLYAPEMVFRPSWLADFLRDGLSLDVPNVQVQKGGPPLSVAEASVSMRGSAPTWEDMGWIRNMWPGPIMVKGILSADDARKARDSGADAVGVSNHGGNALDSVPPALKVLPTVVDAVGSEVQVLMDGGIRRGSDVVKAMALGADAVLIGRSYIWGLAAGGEDGVAQVLRIMQDGIQRTLALLGCSTLEGLDRYFCRFPESWLS
jgi:isopentenyl diphosphate isomerase/L-lactate dehydrogenase-like FMN-dependent dehydrogenase